MEHAHCSTGVNLNVIRVLSSLSYFQKLLIQDRAFEHDCRTQIRIVDKKIRLQKNDLEFIVRVCAQRCRTLRTGPHFNLATQVADLLQQVR